jgi:hypothetical protein
MMNLVFDKTDKGREEIATRKYHLSAKLRGLLLIIDGKHSGESLLKKFAGVGLSDQVLKELLENDFIHTIAPAAAAPEPANIDATVAQQEKPASTGVLAEGETQYQSIYNFYSETIKNTIGLRGYALQLKVERAGSIEDFRALRTAYLEAVFKAKGAEMARSLRDRLDQLLYFGETPPPHTNTPGPNF